MQISWKGSGFILH